MTPSQIFIAAVVVILFLVLVFFGRKNSITKGLTILTSIAFAFIVAGIVFTKNPLISYSLFIIGISLSIVDAYINSKK